MAPKRKRTNATSTATTRRTRPREMPFRLLDLPPELRNRIYSYFTTGAQRVRILSTGKRDNPRVIMQHPLSWVSRQVHLELSREVATFGLENANLIIGEVVDFDFSRVTSYFKRIVQHPGTDMAHFDWALADNDPNRRRLVIQLTVTKQWSRSHDFKALQTWFAFVDGNIKQGQGQMPVRYDFADVEELADTRRIVHAMAEGQGQESGWWALKSGFDFSGRWETDQEFEGFLGRVRFTQELQAGVRTVGSMYDVPELGMREGLEGLYDEDDEEEE